MGANGEKNKAIRGVVQRPRKSVSPLATETDGEFLRRARALLGMSQKEMADTLLCGQPNISWIENDRQNMAALAKRDVIDMLKVAKAEGWPNDAGSGAVA